MFWSVDQSSVAQMPVDVNQICVEGIEKANASTAGRFFIAGGGPPVGQAGEAANAIKVSITMTKQCIIYFYKLLKLSVKYQ